MIYTAIVDDYDTIPDCGIHVFTENRWFSNPRMAAKIYKVLPHLYFDENTVWLDGNIRTKLSEAELVEKYLGNNDIAMFRHPYRETTSEEYETIFGVQHDKRPALEQYWNRYKHILGCLPLYECNVLIRRNNKAVQRFNERWWALICRWSQRDQLTFSIALMDSGLSVGEITPLNVRTHPDFEYVSHLKEHDPKVQDAPAPSA